MKTLVGPIVVLLALATSCAAADEVESRVDCDTICDKYADCYDSDYDTEACASDCEAEYDADPDYIEKIDDCEACIDDKSCSESTFSCVDECVGIVP